MTKSIQERRDELVTAMAAKSNWEDRYRLLIKMGRELPEIPEAEKADQFLVKGCISRAWLIPELKDGRVFFRADSDAAIVKGIIALLVTVYSGATPEEILTTSPEFLKEVGISDHLSMNRRNGLMHFTKQIQLYATAYKAMAASK